MKRALSAACAFLLMAATAQAEAPTPDGPPAQGPVLTEAGSWLMTAANGRRYQMLAAWPKTPPPPEGYAVVYVLDGNIMFNTMAETVRAMARRPGMQQTVIIGIGYPPELDRVKERTLDLTARIGSDAPTLAGSGGAEAFLQVLETELKPEIARRFAIDPAHETLFGHSFGGHFVLYALVNKPALFDTWIAASPSIWVEGRLLARDNLRKRLAPKLADTGATPRVLLTVGEYEQGPDPDFPNPRMAQLQINRQVDNAREFAGFLASVPGIEARFELIANEDHGTVIPAAISRGVRFTMSRTAAAPVPAAKPAAYQNRTGIPIPAASAYLQMTPDARYRLRMRGRALKSPQRETWTAEFDRMLNSGLTYGQHRQLAEEKTAMDVEHGTLPPKD